MQTRRLGRTGVEVSVLGFGAAAVGNLYRATDHDGARAAVDAAWSRGVRYFDTAPHYGLGLSERRLGAALATRRRTEYTISTKVGRLLVTNPCPTGSDLDAGGFAVPDDLMRIRDYSRDGVLRSIDASLARLGMDRVDVVYVHDPEDHLDQAVEEAIPALIALRDQGTVRAIGVGTNFVAPLRRILTETDIDAIMLAGRYTLVDRTGQTLLDECLRRHVSVVAAAPFNSGLLARSWPADGARFDYAPAADHTLHRAREFARTCDRFGAELPHAAMRFPLRHPAVASVVVGLRTADHVTSAADWTATPLPTPLWDALDTPPETP